MSRLRAAVDRRPGLWAYAACVGLAALGRPASYAAPPARDLGQYMYVGTVVLDGGAPYVDAANNKGPANYLLWAGIRQLAGTSPLVVRVLLLLAVGLAAMALGGWVAHHAGRAAGVLAGAAFALLSSAFGFEGYDANNAQFGIVPLIVAVFLATRPGRAERIGAGAGLAFAVWMNPAFALGVPLVAWELWRGGAGRGRRFAEALAGGLAVSAPLLLWVGLTGGLDDMITQTLGQASRAVSPDGTTPVTPPTSTGSAPLQFLLDLPDPALWIAGLAGCAVAARVRGLRPLAVVAALWMLAWFLRVEVASYAFPNQYVPALAGIAVGIALGVASLWPADGWGRVALSALVLAAPVWIAIVAPQLTELDTPAESRNVPGTNEIVDFLRERTPPGSSLLVVGYDPQIYWLAERRAPTRFFDSFGLANRAEYVAERRRDLERTPPDAIVARSDAVPDPDVQALLNRGGYELAFEQDLSRIWLRQG